MIENEDYISIEIWNEQAGVWQNIDEATSMEDAQVRVLRKIASDEAAFVYNTYSIVQHKRTCFGKYAPASK